MYVRLTEQMQQRKHHSFVTKTLMGQTGGIVLPWNGPSNKDNVSSQALQYDLHHVTVRNIIPINAG